ncbi:MAG: DUF3291 domain-containing protein [Geminicoccaceae bacterium]
MSQQWHLAQLNIARPRAALDHPVMTEFMTNLERINGLGDRSPGFVWRLQDEGGDATGLEQPFGPGIIVNLTLWYSLEALRAYVYRTEHTAFLRRRGEWFQGLPGPHLVLWWVSAGHRPTLGEAKSRLERLALMGPTAEAFTFARGFDADGLQRRRAATG